MQRSTLMPFFWAKLVASALLAGSLVTGCAAAGGSGEDVVDELANPSTASPTTPVRPTTPAAPTAQDGSGATPAATGSTPVTSNVTPAGGGEQTPAPSRDDGAAPPQDAAGEGANPGAGVPAGDDDDRDDDGDDDDDRDDDDGDDDDGDDDDGDDDDGDDDDGDDDDDDGAGTNPTPTPNPDPVTPPPADAVTFTADIRPILLDNCGRCHASGGLPNFASNDAARGYDVAFAERNSIVGEIRGGDMPADTCNGAPGSNGCVSVADFALIQQWVAAGAPE